MGPWFAAAFSRYTVQTKSDETRRRRCVITRSSQKFNTGREVVGAVVRGDAEIGIGFTSEFLPVKGVKVVGALPRELEFVNEYSAYIPATSATADSAQALLAYLARPDSRDIFKAAGVGM
jgi:ABC-type molybdate transport system substrate-binding protein